jgi:hypothetical protein
MLAGRFPFGIYYREHGDETQVFAILDLRRKPKLDSQGIETAQ